MSSVEKCHYFPCGSGQGLEQLGDASGGNVEVYAEEVEVNVSVCGGGVGGWGGVGGGGWVCRCIMCSGFAVQCSTS